MKLDKLILIGQKYESKITYRGKFSSVNIFREMYAKIQKLYILGDP